ncbi:HXXEE domain-containing protein [Streptomyces tauricus]|uniref:HXXEE domain-containing protein n=1 Tax=Streptomyces tauricus TaxID=68274 RepID=UPI00387F0CB8
MKRTTKVSVGLFVTWAVSDLEEVWTMSRTSKVVLRTLPSAVPIPEPLRREGISQRHVVSGIGVAATVMAAAMVQGVRSEGRSPVFRGALLGFGLHGFGHLAMAAAARQYVSGVVTAPTMVIPYWLWARNALAKAGIRDIDGTAVAVAAAGMPMLLGAHALMYRLRRSNGPC